MIDYTLPLEKLPDPLPIEPLRKPFDVTITPPGSKSITNRAYVIAALAMGESRIIRPLRADDTDLLLKALCTLGAEARWEGEDVLIKGVNGRFPRGGHVNLGDGGTPTRFMIACACLAAEPVVVDGSPRMRERPIAEGVDMLRQLGAKIEYVEEEGRLPVRVEPSEKFAGSSRWLQTHRRLEIPGTESGQFISALLLLTTAMKGGLTLSLRRPVTSWSYVRMTCRMLEDLKALVTSRVNGDWHEITVPQFAVPGFELRVEPDASSQVYWFAAAAICPASRTINPWPRHSPFQPDSYFWSVLVDMGARPDGFSIVGPPRLSGIVKDMSDMPDASMAVATTCALADNSSRITGLRTLRVKETDRIAALANELRKVGCAVETGEDWINIDPRGSESRAAGPVVIETYNDHRMAMAFAVLGLVRPGISIRNPACVRKSYPTFWQDFAKLYQ